MTHKDAPPASPEQQRMEHFYKDMLIARGVTFGWSRDKSGNYHADYARDAWSAWCAAQQLGKATRQLATPAESIAVGAVTGLIAACVGVYPLASLAFAAFIALGIYIAPNANDEPKFPG